MKRTIIITIIFLSIVLAANAQPLPPSTPDGNSAPVEGLLALLPMALMVLGIIKLKGKKKK